jgi:hypothetical protein
MKSFKKFIAEGLEAELIGLLKSFGAGEIEVEEDHLSTTLRKKQQVWDIIARLPAWVDYDVFVYETDPATAGKSLENPAGTDNTGIAFDGEDGHPDNSYIDDEIGFEDLTDQFHEYELVVYLYNTEMDMVEESKKEKKEKNSKTAAEEDQGDGGSDTAGTDAEYEWVEMDDNSYLSEGAVDKGSEKTVKVKKGSKTITIVATAVDKYKKDGWTLVEGTLAERRRIIKVNARGQRRIKIKCKKGYKYANGKCIKITGSEMTKKRRAIKKSVRTKKQKGSGFQRRVQRLRKRALKKRKSMGLNTGFDVQAQMPKTHSLKQSHEPAGEQLSEGRTYKNGAKIDTKKTEVVYKVPSKDGKSTFVVVYVENPKGAGSQDKYEMYTVDKGFNVVLSHGTHPSLEGSKKFAKSRGLAESVEELDEARYPVGKYGAKSRGDAKAQWMKTYEQEVNNRKDAKGMAGKIDWNVATHNFFMGVDAKTAAQTVKMPWKE